MQPGDRIKKSPAGRAALAGRSHDLPPGLRTLLLMIYGDKTAAEYSELASRLPVGREGFQQLLELGLIEPIQAAPPTASLSASATDALRPDVLQAPIADVAQAVASHTVDEAAQQHLLYPEFVRAVADLGLRGMMLQMKVERAMSAKELLALRDAVEAAIGKSKGDSARHEFSKRIDFLLTQ